MPDLLPYFKTLHVSIVTTKWVIVLPRNPAKGQIRINRGTNSGYGRAGHAQDEVCRRWQEGRDDKHEPGQDKGITGKAVGPPPDFLIGQGPGCTDTEEVIETRLGQVVADQDKEQSYRQGYYPADQVGRAAQGHDKGGGINHPHKEDHPQAHYLVGRLKRG
ncbi:uncharacterized conserved protein [Moorella thermoacetica Y72]|uniref:Uncharacterized conserved protein n=1 Tax=Moorella thermoacetica Y72 TaxID=1325331 RepID=A0A0S6U9A7_NEOTH|nr:uncharacterized conserved protein [Moorella thermoacetica Y72]